MRSNTANPDSFRKYLIVALAIGAALLMLPLAAGALSCAMPVHALGEAYDAADSIIIGLVTDCAEPVSSDPWAGGGAGCSFDTLEVLKASNPARDYRGTADSQACGLALQVGNQYLLFLDKENRPLSYSASLNGDPDMASLPREHVRILRQFRDGAVADLSKPWMFWENKATCTMSRARIVSSAQSAPGRDSPAQTRHGTGSGAREAWAPARRVAQYSPPSATCRRRCSSTFRRT